MGLNSSTKKEKTISTSDIKIVRQSWKDLTEIGDYKSYGLNMMIKFVIVVLLLFFQLKKKQSS